MFLVMEMIPGSLCFSPGVIVVLKHVFMSKIADVVEIK